MEEAFFCGFSCLRHWNNLNKRVECRTIQNMTNPNYTQTCKRKVSDGGALE